MVFFRNIFNIIDIVSPTPFLLRYSVNYDQVQIVNLANWTVTPFSDF